MTHSDQEGSATVSPPSPANPLRLFALRIAEAAILSYVEYRDQHATADVDDVEVWARAKATSEVAGALDTYGIVAAYPDLVKAAQWAFVTLQLNGLYEHATQINDALALSEKSFVGDVAEGTAETPEDAPL